MSGKRYLFYDSTDGEIFHHYARRRNPQSVERVIEIYPEISQRSQESYGVLVINYEQYTQDFDECNSYRVNPKTKELEISYPDPNAPEEPQPYRAPLSETVNENMDYLIDVDFRLSMVELGLI